jgi:hypothetical protein
LLPAQAQDGGCVLASDIVMLAELPASGVKALSDLICSLIGVDTISG